MSQVSGIPTRRRAYKKSTAGCANCKTRKIKCDEAKPACGHCKRRYVNPTSCHYASVASKGKDWVERYITPPNSSGSSLIGVPSPISPYATGLSERDRLLELRLLHHYTKTTCGVQSLADMVPLFCHPMWEIDIPQMAFSSEIVLNALLAISAIHMHTINPAEKALSRASRSYLDRAVKRHRLAMVEVDSETAEPLLVAAVLIAHHTWLTAHAKDPKTEQYRIDLQTYHMCQGIASIIGSSKPWLEKYDWPVIGQIPHLNDLPHEGFLQSALMDLSILSHAFSSEDVSVEDRETYEKVADNLAETYSALTSKALALSMMEQKIVTFLHRVPARFVTLLEREEPISMALMARNMAVFVFLEKSVAWWVHGSGEHKVYFKAVWGIHSLMPSGWLWTMDWPLKVISREITLEQDWVEDRR